MSPPATYAEWVACLERLHEENSDEDVLAAMEHGTLTWTSGVADRFVTRLADTVDHRLKRAADFLSRDLSRTRGNTAHLTNAILSARRRIAVVMRLAQLPILPGDVQQQMTEIVSGYAESAQKAMEESAKQDRSGKVLSLLRSNAISNLQAAPPDAGLPQDADTLPGRPRRSVIIP